MREVSAGDRVQEVGESMLVVRNTALILQNNSAVIFLRDSNDGVVLQSGIH